MIFFYDDKRNALVCALDGGAASIDVIRHLGYFRIDDVALFRLPRFQTQENPMALRHASRAAARGR